MCGFVAANSVATSAVATQTSDAKQQRRLVISNAGHANESDTNYVGGCVLAETMTQSNCHNRYCRHRRCYCLRTTFVCRCTKSLEPINMCASNACPHCRGCLSRRPPKLTSNHSQCCQLSSPCDLAPSSAAAPKAYLSQRARAALASRTVSANPSQCVEEVLRHFCRPLLHFHLRTACENTLGINIRLRPTTLDWRSPLPQRD